VTPYRNLMIKISGRRLFWSGRTTCTAEVCHKLQSTALTVNRCLLFMWSHWRPLVLRSGFKDLVPNFTICDAGGDEQYLPTANKCHNLLKVCLHLFHVVRWTLTPSFFGSSQGTKPSTYCATSCFWQSTLVVPNRLLWSSVNILSIINIIIIFESCTCLLIQTHDIRICACGLTIYQGA
jgi:hypothetical protein